jgi:glutathionylspermidine synthase
MDRNPLMTFPFQAGPNLSYEQWSRLRLRAIFDHCKWDPQCGDHAVLSRFPLLLEAQTANQLADLAERLTREALAAEVETLGNPELLSRLAIPSRIRKCLAKAEPDLSKKDIRVMRFDFHYTTHGWQISEVNADVPGGYIEASGWNELFADQVEDFSAPCSPTKAFARAICEAAPRDSLIALVHATVYSEDRQVMVHLSRELARHGMRPQLVSPRNLAWDDGEAKLATAFASGNPAVIVRLSPAEWLPSMRDGDDWERWFRESRTALSNPGRALILQSKRFPLIWDELKTELSTWRKLLPESACPSQIKNLDQDAWVLKPAFGRVGEDVGIRGVTEASQHRAILRAARKRENLWIAQQRFEVVPIPTENGDVFPCIGVFTVNGRMAGLYGRAAHTALIDHNAFDVAVLVRRETTGRLQ